MQKIIFLDIDGVLNCENAYTSAPRIGRDEFGDLFYEPSKKLLNELIEETGSDIVISSMWRLSGLQVMQDMWSARKMAGKVIDVTPFINVKDVCVPRGTEISTWLYERSFYHIAYDKQWQQDVIEKSQIYSYVIIDDDRDMLLEQDRYFVHVAQAPQNKDGFNYWSKMRAKKILDAGVMGISFPEESIDDYPYPNW